MRHTIRTRPRFTRASPLQMRPGDYRRQANNMKKLGPVLIVSAAALVFIAVLVSISVVRTSSHPAIGRWRAGILVLRVDPDKVATVNGVVCSWSKVDGNTIRIQPSTKIGNSEWGTIEVAFDLIVQAGGQKAVAEVFGYPMTLDREP